MVVCFEIEENLEKKSNSLGLARCIIYVREVNGSKIKICQLVNVEFVEDPDWTEFKFITKKEGAEGPTKEECEKYYTD